jgi:microcystin-dependent protein
MPVYTQTILSPDPLYLQPKSYDARSDRKWFADIFSPGVVGLGDFNVTAVSGNMNITIASGVAYILGQNVTDQGMYREYTPNTSVMTVPGNSSGNPRIDSVILRVMDNAADSSTFNECRIEIVPGTPTTGADLANLSGKANLTTLGENSKSVLLLGYILVPTGASVLTTAGNIKDVRSRASVGGGLASGGIPVGATLEWNSTTLPAGGFYLTEDGSAISRTGYAQAFSIIGTAAGVGDGSTTYNIPDSRGRVPVGYAPSGGHADVSTLFGNEGLAVGSRRTRHKHTVTDPGHSHLYTTVTGIGQAGSGDAGGSGTAVTASATTGVLIGPQTGAEPTDTPAYIVKHKLLRVF